MATRGYSRLLQEAITDFGADEPYARVGEKLRRHYGIEIATNAAREVTLHHARSLQARGILPEPSMAPPVSTLIAETDGSMIPCVKTDANDPAADRRKMRQLHWKEVKLCLVRREGEVSPLFGATTEDAEAAGVMLQALAASAGRSASTYVHGVGDGAPWVANQMALRFGEAGYYLIDFYHLCEYLAAAAKRCDADSRAWLAQQKERLKSNASRA